MTDRLEALRVETQGNDSHSAIGLADIAGDLIGAYQAGHRPLPEATGRRRPCVRRSMRWGMSGGDGMPPTPAPALHPFGCGEIAKSQANFGQTLFRVKVWCVRAGCKKTRPSENP